MPAPSCGEATGSMVSCDCCTNYHILGGSKQHTVVSPQLWKPSVQTTHQQICFYHEGSPEGPTPSPPDFDWCCCPWIKATSSQSSALRSHQLLLCLLGPPSTLSAREIYGCNWLPTWVIISILNVMAVAKPPFLYEATFTDMQPALVTKPLHHVTEENPFFLGQGYLSATVSNEDADMPASAAGPSFSPGFH